MTTKSKTFKMRVWKTKNCRYPESIFIKIDGYPKPIAFTDHGDKVHGHLTMHKALVALLKGDAT